MPKGIISDPPDSPQTVIATFKLPNNIRFPQGTRIEFTLDENGEIANSGYISEAGYGPLDTDEFKKLKGYDKDKFKHLKGEPADGE